jgi:hypothetical protein
MSRRLESKNDRRLTDQLDKSPEQSKRKITKKSKLRDETPSSSSSTTKQSENKHTFVPTPFFISPLMTDASPTVPTRSAKRKSELMSEETSPVKKKKRRAASIEPEPNLCSAEDEEEKNIKPKRTTTQRRDEALIKSIMDDNENDASSLAVAKSAGMVRPSIPTMPVQKIRTVLSDIRKRYKDVGVVFCSDHILKDMTVGEFSFQYVLGNARKRYEKHQRTSTKKQLQDYRLPLWSEP